MPEYKAGDIVDFKHNTCVVIAKEDIFERFHPDEYWIRFEGWLPVAFRVKAEELTLKGSVDKGMLKKNNNGGENGKD